MTKTFYNLYDLMAALEDFIDRPMSCEAETRITFPGGITFEVYRSICGVDLAQVYVQGHEEE